MIPVLAKGENMLTETKISFDPVRPWVHRISMLFLIVCPVAGIRQTTNLFIKNFSVRQGVLDTSLFWM